jgi:hypothetical protein
LRAILSDNSFSSLECEHRVDPMLSLLRPYDPLLSARPSSNLHNGLVSGVARHPLNVSTLTSVPHSTSATARYTSPVFPFLLDTCTSDADKLPSPFRLDGPPASRAMVEPVRGKTWTGSQAGDDEEARRALQYDREVLRASVHAAPSLYQR